MVILIVAVPPQLLVQVDFLGKPLQEVKKATDSNRSAAKIFRTIIHSPTAKGAERQQCEGTDASLTTLSSGHAERL